MNPSRQLLSLDIGSTFTKGALFSLDGDTLRLEKRCAVPTTTSHLPDGVLGVLCGLLEVSSRDWDALPELPQTCFSSSAKGGLHLVVVGLVPELSVQIGKLTAWSAGARISHTFSHQLTQADLEKIELARPDMILLCGGTDGGHEATVRKNAEALATRRFDGTIVYAGNRALADDVRALFSRSRMVITDNVMPDFGRFNPEPARAVIQRTFLEQIVSGKGLESLVKRFACEPLPTPLAVFELVTRLPQAVPDWSEFVAVDMGGATTDVYSQSEAVQTTVGTILRGIHEPTVKRSVEGDLGVRVSAASLWQVLKPQVTETLGGSARETLDTWVARVSANPGLLPQTDEERESDATLAAGCLFNALQRHAGAIEPVWTPEGQVWLQTGKDLRRVPKLVLTGGFPSANADLPLFVRANSGLFKPERSERASKTSLAPQAPATFVDHSYLWPLLGNLVRDFPAAVCRLAVASLNPQPVSPDPIAIASPNPANFSTNIHQGVIVP
jgi:uncharacterized protein (TIGR01319 family)